LLPRGLSPEKLITKAKKGGVHRHRQVVSFMGDKEMASKLFSDIAPRYEGRPGGYTRILKLGPRQGDNASMARIELV
jgi:large subunit ribosomal protein L17